MESSTSVGTAPYYARILESFAELGFSHDLIGQWTLPLRDAETLIGVLQECQPRNILEVGTFVGMTTLLMALTTSPETHIHTVDPNFPVQVEMASMKSRLYGLDASIKAQDLALQAAERLGVDKKITFHAGGFSTSHTFASYNVSPASRIHIIGPEVCNEFGPFDFIFIDGLHYEEDVHADLNLAAEHLAPGGRIAVHDVLGPWGSNVRRAVFRFLEKHPEFFFSHGRYADLYNAIGLLRHGASLDQVGESAKDDGKNKGLIQEKMLPNLGAILIQMFSPASVIQIGNDFALLRQLQDYGVPEVCALTLASQPIQKSNLPMKQFNPDERLHIEKKYDLCLCLNVMDSVSVESINAVIQACVDASNTVIFASTPPGETGNWNNKPVSFWVKKFYEKGYLFFDAIRPVLEPINSSDVINAEYEHNSSYLMNLYLVKKDDNLDSDKITKSYLEEILLCKESRIEDLHLQNLYQKNIINNYKKITDNYKKEYDRLIDTINIFNKTVYKNTLKMIKEKYLKNRLIT